MNKQVLKELVDFYNEEYNENLTEDQFLKQTEDITKIPIAYSEIYLHEYDDELKDENIDYKDELIGIQVYFNLENLTCQSYLNDMQAQSLNYNDFAFNWDFDNLVFMNDINQIKKYIKINQK